MTIFDAEHNGKENDDAGFYGAKNLGRQNRVCRELVLASELASTGVTPPWFNYMSRINPGGTLGKMPRVGSFRKRGNTYRRVKTRLRISI